MIIGRLTCSFFWTTSVFAVCKNWGGRPGPF